jgi:hypothetical protein
MSRILEGPYETPVGSLTPRRIVLDHDKQRGDLVVCAEYLAENGLTVRAQRDRFPLGELKEAIWEWRDRRRSLAEAVAA